jgi:hypothetical protein
VYDPDQTILKGPDTFHHVPPFLAITVKDTPPPIPKSPKRKINGRIMQIEETRSRKTRRSTRARPRRRKAGSALDSNAALCRRKSAHAPQFKEVSPPEVLIAEAFDSCWPWRLRHSPPTQLWGCRCPSSTRVKRRRKKSNTVALAISVCFCPYQTRRVEQRAKKPPRPVPVGGPKPGWSSLLCKYPL